MGTLTETFDRNQDAQRVIGWGKRFLQIKDDLGSIFFNIEIIKAKYSPGTDEYIEIEAKITQGKAEIQAVLDAH